MAQIQTTRPFEIITPLGEDVLLFHRMTATEELGHLFQFEIELLSKDPNIKFEKLLGQNVTIRLNLPDDKTRYFNGFVSRFSQEDIFEDFNVYHMTVHPWLWFLTRTADCRIYQDKKVPDIIKEVFRDHGFTDFEEALSGTYRTWEYCVQYRETDFNFVSRLMEQEGIYYYFKHEKNKHTLVFADSVSSHEAFPGYEKLRYYPEDENFPREKDHIYHWSISQEVQPGVYALNDFDFKRPKANLLVKSAVKREYARSTMEIFDYPGEYIQSNEGEAYARDRIQELQVDYERLMGHSNARGLSVGHLFELKEHPREDQNREYLVVSATHEMASDDYASGSSTGEGDVYSCSFTVLSSKQPYRSPRTTPKPMIRGPQTAVVVGSSGEEIFTDKYGRVKIQFHWDRYGKYDENSSCWVRVSHSWAGKKWGSIAIPRIGQEVIVEFLEGDPDRPIITGRVYNNVNMPPYKLPDEKTKSTIKTNSSKGGKGFNEIRFEDAKDKEEIFIHGEKDLNMRVKNDRKEWIGRDRHLFAKRDKLEEVDRDGHVIIKRDEMKEIGRDHNLKVKGKDTIEVIGSRSVKVQGDIIEVCQGKHSEQVTQDYYVKGMNVVVEGMTGLTIKVGGSFITLDSGGVFISGPMVMLNSGGSALSGVAGNAVAPLAPLAAAIAGAAEPGRNPDNDAQTHNEPDEGEGEDEKKP